MRRTGLRIGGVWLYLAVGGLLVPVCSGCAQRPAGAGAVLVRDLPILWQTSGLHCGIRVPLRLVVRDEAHMVLLPIADVPVDFDRQMVLFVTPGLVPSSGYGVRIERVWQQGNVVKVSLRYLHPAQRVSQPFEPCTPYHLVVVPKSDLNVEGFVVEPPPDALRRR